MLDWLVLAGGLLAVLLVLALLVDPLCPWLEMRDLGDGPDLEPREDD